MSDGSKLKLESDLADVNVRMRTKIDIKKCARVRSKDECKSFSKRTGIDLTSIYPL